MKWIGWFFLTAALCTANPVDDAIATGRKALANDGFATAWRIAQQALKDAPDSAAAHEFAGEVLFRQGDIAQADAEFKIAVEWNPRLAAAWWGLGRVAECTSMNKTAMDDYQRAYQLDPKDPRMQAAFAARGRKQEPVETLVSPYKATEVPLQAFTSIATHLRNYGVELLLNGQRTRLVLDTGAAGIVLSHPAAERAGLTRVADAKLGGVGDNTKPTTGYRAIADTFKLGEIEYHNVPLNVADQSFVGIEDGLIGANVLSDFVTTIDFGAGKLRLDPLPDFHPGDGVTDRVVTPQMESATRVYRFGHILLVPVNVGAAKNRLFVLDTGASSSLISNETAALVSSLNRDGKTSLRGLSGRIGDVYQTGNLTLEFAGFQQRQVGMTAFDTWQLSHRLGTEISGFLGLPVLDLFTLTIDYRDGLVKFERGRQ